MARRKRNPLAASERAYGNRKWIQGAIKKPGALRAQLGVSAGETIPIARLRKAAKAKGKLGRRARLALTLRKLRGRKKRKLRGRK